MLQRSADRTITKHIAEVTQETRETMGGVSEGAQGALVALDPFSGDIRALVPGRRTQRGGFNRAFSARRQPGSAFKPFVYEAAIAAGYKPSEPVDDEPVEVDIGRTVWQPANYNDEYNGRITLRARAVALGERRDGARESRGRRAGGDRRGAPERHHEPAHAGAVDRARRGRRDAGRAGGGLRAVRQRRRARASRGW